MVGGRGISTIYACRKYSFNKIYGFDFNQGLINDAITNVLEMKSCNSNDIVFFKADANSYILPNENITKTNGKPYIFRGLSKKTTFQICVLFTFAQK